MAEITDVRVYRVEGTGNLRAYAAVTLDDAYVIHGLRVLEGEAGFWVGMPASKNKKTGEFKDIFHPITREARDILVKTVISRYEEGAPEQAEEAEQASETEVPESSKEEAGEEPAEETQETPEEKVEE
ncbi:MAG: SpoVG family protein [Candidatus Hydrothermarchaeaceae archaeon]